jgi:predicted nuclease of predicted toxin-antitoxin system
VKLLFDENLSRPLVGLLADLYPGSEHAVTSGLERADDLILWRYAAAHGLTLVSKDWDFLQLSTVRGHPRPRWSGCGSATARSGSSRRCCGSGTSICSGPRATKPPRC